MLAVDSCLEPLEFGFVAAGETARISTHLRNSGSLPITVKLSAGAPIKVHATLLIQYCPVRKCS